MLDDEGSIIGPVGPGGFTDDEKPTITGFAEPDSIVRVYSNGELIGSVQAAKNGSWQLDAPLGSGLHNVYVTATDNYNQVSEPSDPYSLHINVPLVDQPVLLSVIDNEGSQQGIIVNNGQTDDKTPQLIGAAPPDAVQVNIYVNGRFIAGVPVHDGKWSWTSAYPLLNDGMNTITLSSQNIRGETSDQTQPFNVFVAPDPIEAPEILKAVDDFGSIQGDLKSGDLTDDKTPMLKGKGVPGAVVEVEYGQASGWKVAGSAAVDANGNWSFTSPALGSDGTWEYRARSVSGASKSDWTGKFVINLDTTPPAEPVITGAYDNEGALKLIADQGVTKDKTPELRGTAEPNSKLILVLAFNSQGWGGSNKTYEVMTDARGNWTVKIPDDLADGRWYFRAKSVDAAGNTTVLSPQYYFDVIAAPVITHVVDDAGTVQGNVQHGGVIQVNIYVNGRFVAGVPVHDGKWSWTSNYPILNDGSNVITLRAQNIRGEVSEETSPFNVTVSPDPIETPQILKAVDDFGSVKGDLKSGGLTDDTTPVLHGTGTPGAIIEIQYGLSTEGWRAAGTAVVDARGNWSFTSPILTSEGTWEYRARANVDGRTGGYTGKFKVVLSTEAPEAPQILSAFDNAGPVTGVVGNKGLTDDRTPELGGKGAPGSIIYFNMGKPGGSWVAAGSTVVAADGTWKYTPPQVSGDGTWQYRAQSAHGGKLSGWSESFWLYINKDASKTPEITHAVDNAGVVQGDVKHGGLTDDKTPTLKGKGIPGAVIEFEYGKYGETWKTAGSAVADANGNWSFTSPALGSDGTWEYRARSVNGANKSSWTGKFVINLDTTPPAEPVITGAYDNEGSLTLIADKGIAKDKTPELRGKAEPNSKLILVLAFNSEGWEGNNKTYEVITDANGNWTVKIPDELADGRWHFRAKSVDAAGNTTGLSPQYYFDVISTPVISHAVDNAGAVQGDVKHGGITDDKTPTLKGKGVPNAVIEFEYGKSGEAWKAAGSAVADANGNWSFTSPALGSDGTWEYRARSVNGAGKGNWTGKFTLNVTSYAELPAIDSAADNFGAVTGTLKDGALTDDFTPTLKGKAMASTLVYLHATVVGGGWVSLGSVMTDKNGNWTFESRALAGGNGEYHFQASYTAARNTAAPVFKLNIHATADKAPEITHASDNVGAVQGNIKSGGITDDKTPTLHGKGTAGAVIQVMYCWSGTSNWIVAGSAVVDANGNWQFTSPDLKADGSVYFVARSVNGAKVSDWTDYFTVRMYASADKAPEITHAVDNAGAVQGDVKHGGLTDDKTPTLKGKGLPGAVVEFEYGKYGEAWKAAGSVVVDANGNWSFTSPALGSDGSWEYRARSVNGAKKSSWTGKFVINLDTTPPAEPVITGAYDNEGSLKLIADQSVTKDKTPELRGKAEPNSKLILMLAFNSEGWEGNNKTYEVMTDAKGNWTVKIPDELADGRWHFRAKSVDAAGNSTGLSPQYYFDIIAAPVITHVVDDAGTVKGNVQHGGVTDDKTPTLKGKGEPGAIIEVIFGLSTDGWKSAGSAKVDASGNWSLTSPQLAKDGVWEYRARSISGSKVSPYTEKFIFNLDTTAPALPVITGAYENDGALKPIADKGWSKDKTPELRGTAEPNSKLILVLALNGEDWGTRNKTYEVMTDARGNWTVKIPDALAEGRWHFRAKSIDAAGNTTELSPQYYFQVGSVPPAPEITNAVDNAGSVTGNVQHGGITDDKTPTLHGKGVPGAVIEVKYNKAGSSDWILAGSAVVDASGNWRVTSPDLKNDGTVYFAARAISDAKSSAWSATFKVNIYSNSDKAPEITHAVDDAGAVQGNVKHGGVTDDKTPTLHGKGTAGAVIEVKYCKAGTSEWIVAGTAVVDANGNWRLTSPDLKTDGTVHFAAHAINGAKISDWSNTFTVNVSANKSGYEDFSSIKTSFDVHKGSSYTTSNGLKITTLESFAMIGQGGEKSLVVNSWLGKAKVKMDFGLTSDVSFSSYGVESYSHVPTRAQFYSSNGELLHTKNLSTNGGWTKYSYTAPQGKAIAYVIFEAGHNGGSADTFYVDNIRWGTTVGKNALSSINDISAMEHNDDVHAISIDKGNYELKAADILLSGEKDLFIDNGKTQLMVNGNQGDNVRLEDILPEGSDQSGWAEQAGTVTIAGTQYHVFSNGDAELLVQQGVKTELV
ncbi:Ig-like domain-containing protein [Pantoea dispersa]|uniref:Ig-like domain-containing protein n=1 Tax=Pantoea dispersa TaxID=59814 RepID=UPI0021C7401F|nr:Ig-like domain-containing protein [Pantoea dispersa]